MIDGDVFEQLARDLGLYYTETYNLAPHYLNRVEDIRALPGRVNVLSHNSDGAILPVGRPTRENTFVWDNIPENVNYWFAQNVDVRDDRLIPIPIGLECDSFHPPSQKKDIIRAMPIATDKKLAYMNHTIRTPLRETLYEQFGSKDWCTAEAKVSFERFAHQLSTHKFTFSPDGNGMDCIRTWETLYLRSFPIVERHVFTEKFAEHLPLLIVDDWDQVTEVFLNDKYEEFVNTKWNWELLEISYWENMMKETINE